VPASIAQQEWCSCCTKPGSWLALAAAFDNSLGNEEAKP
jgi:hypothetical protein